MSATHPVEPVKALRDAVALALRTQPLPLFAILDAARSPRALHLLKASTEEHACLYDGESAKKLAHVAPYLVRFSRYSELLQALVHEGWGESWGIYMTCDKDFAEIRKHFRHFLMVEVDGEGSKKLLFRFYDPRVLLAYLPTCTQEELQEFFGPIVSFFLHGKDRKGVLRFRRGARGLEQNDATSSA